MIYKPTRSVMTSGRKGAKQWILRFERRLAPYVEPLMGWTADDDPMAHVELMFDSLKSAIRYAEDQGLHYRVLNQVSTRNGSGIETFSALSGTERAQFGRVDLADLQDRH